MTEGFDVMEFMTIIVVISIFSCVWYCLGNIDALIKKAYKWEDDELEK